MGSSILTPADFKPTWDDPVYFQQGMFVMGPGMGGGVSMTPINPLYCATMHTANVMCQVLTALGPIKIVLNPPLGVWTGGGNPFQQVGQVPWLVFPDGLMENAGLIAGMWTHGYPLNYVEQEAAQVVQADMQAHDAAAQ